MDKKHIVNLNDVAISTVEALFGFNFIDTLTYQTESIPNFKTKYIVQIGLRNHDYQLCIILGLEDGTAEKVFGEIMSLDTEKGQKEELAKSALGELVNTMACEMANSEEIVHNFGRFHPTPPLVWIIEDQPPDFFEADGITGRISNSQHEIYTHISVLPTTRFTDRYHWNPTKSLSIFDPHSMDNKKK